MPPRAASSYQFWFDSYRIFFPKAEHASSTARSAVRLCSPMTGLTSTIVSTGSLFWPRAIAFQDVGRILFERARPYRLRKTAKNFPGL